MFRNRKVHVDQSQSTIGVDRITNINTVRIAGKVVNHGPTSEITEGVDLSEESIESIGIGFSKNVWVNGKRVC
ncbi:MULTISPECIES: hypothetical protein [unclassified Microcoleus]|uniref:hypothetical protein n=1 Tax=unclassified Microcoleus TaxID=2642155 RepID=UPI001D5B7637|nr:MULTISPECIES: hypothetical protein [unclassified Microcoleus]MCC3506250.1 hypothetical protein [Microcoleus sp. PH2017_19_SFW_U_A]MCC3508317.1 hypothetical protein [Microcoleus sp. PH2017_17_BER_D_A]TAE66768.1 MAG: hypothetical protein EAZ86_19215 [Oscillatoriales cyanobacterium]MCC3473969.1 hypothetical protein [Microcoleus sp. PH2017_13_LAR_U_A]MCC3486053.1 hypothetical protein [Microcoleus sp. PH2017_14_LAR_D_A]